MTQREVLLDGNINAQNRFEMIALCFMWNLAMMRLAKGLRIVLNWENVV